MQCRFSPLLLSEIGLAKGVSEGGSPSQFLCRLPMEEG